MFGSERGAAQQQGGSNQLPPNSGGSVAGEVITPPNETKEQTIGNIVDRVRTLSNGRTSLPSSEQKLPTGLAPIPVEPGTVTWEEPSDSRFGEYRNWFRQHAVINLVVSGQDRRAMLDALGKLRDLNSRKGVLVGQVIVVGGSKELIYRELLGLMVLPPSEKFSFEQFESMYNRPNTEIKGLLREMNFNIEPRATGYDIVDKLKLTYSPAWVIRYQGQHYIYEGRIDPMTLFDDEGHFQVQGGWDLK